MALALPTPLLLLLLLCCRPLLVPPAVLHIIVVSLVHSAALVLLLLIRDPIDARDLPSPLPTTVTDHAPLLAPFCSPCPAPMS